MNFRNAVELFNDSMRRSKGMDHEGNEALTMTGFGGLASSFGIEYLTTSKSSDVNCPRFKAAEMLRKWAEILEAS